MGGLVGGVWIRKWRKEVGVGVGGRMLVELGVVEVGGGGGPELGSSGWGWEYTITLRNEICRVCGENV